jgi:hypothetical protein
MKFVFMLISKTKNKKTTKMNPKITTKKQTAMIIAVTIIAATSALIFSTNNSQFLQKIREESLAASGIESENAAHAAQPVTNIGRTTTSTNQIFWINTVHLDGLANIHGDPMAMHPPEKFPNSTLPVGGGFVLTPPDKSGAWKFRSFTFDPSMIVVHQGDRVTLHFISVQGTHHVITVNGIGTFTLDRGQIHTVTFIANHPGSINYYCHIHMPNMVGQILVLPATT